ncbi:hypothetical protein ASE35_01355 [Lysobacter sp. Root916]|uniref:DUF998 domain-containing protein n=1 Tax=Lysobacter sp. Root916 TaxID=1736606 RepID=UPI00070CA5EF|nr:DUF998 domain-containing protein [Lysobacter sp. Root916]KRD39050.1 hypothetical protein ASE35_01355 [Lysobacter sp. Root916]
MSARSRPGPGLRAALACAIAVPFVYYATQLIAAPFFPDYSFLRQAASTLGSDSAPLPWIFNSGAVLTGIATLIGAAGIAAALRRLGRPPLAIALVTLALLINAVVSIKAAYFPLPHPRHGSGPLMIGILLFSSFMILALWSLERSGAIKRYLLATNLWILALIPFMAHWTGLDTRACTGLLQRLATLAIYPPIGIAAWYLARRLRAPDPRA